MITHRLSQYSRIKEQLIPLFDRVDDPIARMASIVALLHHKMGHYFWTGFYRHENGRLLAGPYQGSLACMELKKDTGVCWHCFNTGIAVIVPDVHAFPGHIACDSRSCSEIVVPVTNASGVLVAILDVDSTEYGAFTDEDRIGLESISALIYNH